MVKLKQEGITNGELRDIRLQEKKDTTGGLAILFVRKNSMRNKPCGCGSGKKFKKCCWNKFNEVSL